MLRAATIATTHAALLVAAAAGWAATTRPDLFVQSAGLPPDGVGGSTISVRDTVTNKGAAVARSSVTSYWLSVDGHRDAKDILLSGRRTVPRLRAGGSSVGHAQIVLPTNVAGLFEVIVCADATNRVREAKETNNCTAARKPLNVYLPPPPRSG